jgi:hypothetical protein
MDRRQKRVSIFPDRLRQRLTSGLCLGKAIDVHRHAIALQPFRPAMLEQPRWRSHGQFVECRTHGLAHHFQAIEGADGGEHMGRIGALLAARLQHAALLQLRQHGVKQPLFIIAVDQSGPELAQH